MSKEATTIERLADDPQTVGSALEVIVNSLDGELLRDYNSSSGSPGHGNRLPDSQDFQPLRGIGLVLSEAIVRDPGAGHFLEDLNQVSQPSCHDRCVKSGISLARNYECRLTASR